ncbi:MAG: protocatechuate 3,4-dioxygenase [Acinetobacter sp.]
MNPQLKGVESIAGTYIFDIRISNKRLNINRFFWNMIQQQWRDAFQENPQALMQTAALSEYEQQLILEQDWLGLVKYGVNFFVLEKYARVVHKTNLQIYAMMGGMSYEDFMKTRQVPEAT